MKLCHSVHEALSAIESHETVFVHAGAATPTFLLDGLLKEAPRLRSVELLHLHTEGDAAYARPEYKDSFRVTNFFVGPNIRPFLDYDRVDYLPCFLSEMPDLIRSGAKKVDVALIHAVFTVSSGWH